MLLPSCRGCPPAFLLLEGDLKELSIFVDESDSQSGHSRFCLVALLFHDQSDSIDELISDYEFDLSVKGLPTNRTILSESDERFFNRNR